MPLTSTQNTTLKTAIAANTTAIDFGGAQTQIKDIPNSADGNVEIAKWYNLVVSPSFTAWKKNVTVGEVGDKINATELAGLTSLNVTRLQALAQYAPLGFNPSLADRRQAFDDIFSGAGGATTRAALLVLWKRLATNIQKLFSTGTGSDASPATTDSNVGDTFTISGNDVSIARNS